MVSSNLPSDSPLLLARRCADVAPVGVLFLTHASWRQAVAEKYLVNLLQRPELPA
jgi:hypothetical protein